MARVVFVHGIAQQNKDPDRLCESWRTMLNAGLASIATATTSVALARDDVAMVFWGRLFAPAGAQGAGDTDPDSWDPQVVEVAEQLATLWLQHATVADQLELRTAGDEALDELRAPAAVGEEQGPGAVVRRAVELAGRMRMTSHVAFPAMARVMRRSLHQVAVYLSDQEVRDQIQNMVAAKIDDATEVVIGHSLGSVIAFEACHRLAGQLPLLVTLGSPLGLQTVIYDRLQPTPPTFPPQLGHWVNVADPDDIVAARQALAELFPSEARGGRLVDSVVGNPGWWTHGIDGYLRQQQVAYPIGIELMS